MCFNGNLQEDFTFWKEYEQFANFKVIISSTISIDDMVKFEEKN